ncbi:MAG: T9SS type A sorting domain-containing protein [Bacteroidota bacterium]
MKKLFTLFAVCFAFFNSSAQAMQTFHDFSAVNFYTGDTIHMSQFYGKKVMVVNVASLCSYTPQYTPLQELYDLYNQSHNFEIIGFLSNDFGNQAGTDSQIVNTCQDYGITFLITEEVHVSALLHGNNVAPVYQWLEKSSLNGVSNATVSWNFNKFLIDEAGHWVAHYGEGTDPKAPAIVNWILSPSVISSLPDVNTDELFEVRPNPANSCVDCVLKNSNPEHYTIKVYSNQGQHIQTIFDGLASAQNISYPVTSLPAGLYFITVQNKVAQKTFRYSVVK